MIQRTADWARKREMNRDDHSLPPLPHSCARTPALPGTGAEDLVPALPYCRQPSARSSLQRLRRSTHLRALGATSRVPDQSRPALTVEVCDNPAVGAASPISLGSTWPSRPDFGVSSQI